MEKFLSLLSEDEKVLYSLMVAPWTHLPGFKEFRSTKWFNKVTISNLFDDLGTLLLMPQKQHGSEYLEDKEYYAYRAVHARNGRTWLLSLDLITEVTLRGPEEIRKRWPGVYYALKLKPHTRVVLAHDSEWNESVFRASMSQLLQQTEIHTVEDLVTEVVRNTSSFSGQIIASGLPDPQKSWKFLQEYLEERDLPRQSW